MNFFEAGGGGQRSIQRHALNPTNVCRLLLVLQDYCGRSGCWLLVNEYVHE